MMNAAGLPAYSNIRESVRLLGLSRSTLYVNIGKGNIVAIKAGGRTLVDIGSALTWLRSLPAAQIRAPRRA